MASPLTIIALMLAATGLGLLWVSAANTDLSPLPEFVREARNVYLPAARGDAFNGSAVWHEQAPAAHAWKLAWLALNGQWDARVLSIAGLTLEVLALGMLFSLLARCIGSRWLAPLALGAIGFVALSPLAPRPVEAAAWSGGLVVFSLLHIGLMTGSRPRSWIWWLGLACGLVNMLAATAGIASAAALAIWSLLAVARERGSWREQRALLLANGALVGFDLWLAASRTANAESALTFFQLLQESFAWPFGSLALAAIGWLPAIFCFGRWMKRKADHPALVGLALLVVWSAVQAVTLAALHIRATEVGVEALMAGLIVNAACFVVLPREGWCWPTRNLVLVALWGIVIGNALLNPPTERTPVFAGPENEAPVTVALRRAAFDGNADALRRTGVMSEAEIRELLDWLGDAGFRRLLPGSIRPPLPIEPENAVAGVGFRKGAAPTVPGRDDLPALGTWSATGAAETGEFVSQPLESNSVLLRIRICGELRPPDTSVVLRTADGTEIAPLEGVFRSNDRWKRVNFPTPHGPFRIVAHDTSPTLWLAVTAPQEIGRLSWLAGKFARSGAWWFWGGIGLGLGVVVMALWQMRVAPAIQHAADEPRIAWRVVPWLALASYAVFFSHHIDPTAGPNDSGGYLNSAKLLAHGHVTAAPRMIWGPAAGETDITPYLPGTFRATGDGRMAPEYPVGFPLEVAAMAQLLPLNWAVPAVILLQLVLGVVFTWRMARAFGLPDGWAWLAAGLVGVSSVYLFQALQPQSDGPALVWVTAAVWFAWTSREKPWYAILAGFATALAVLIRPSNVLCVIPVLICLAGRWRQLAWWILAGIPAALWQMWYNHALYGSWLSTGYGDVSSGFALRFAPLTLNSYARWLPMMFSPVVWLAFAGPFMRSISLRARLVLTSWAAVFVVFYTFYWCTYDNWYNMRFVLPAMPAVLVLALLALRALAERAGLTLFARGSLWRSTVPSAALVVVLLAFGVIDGVRQRVTYWMWANTLHEVGAVWAREHFPPNAVVFARHATGSLTYYTDLVIVRSDHEKAKTLKFFEQVAATGRPIYALTYHWERRNYKWETGRGDGYPDLPGTWEELAVLRDGELHAWAWHPPAGAVAATPSLK